MDQGDGGGREEDERGGDEGDEVEHYRRFREGVRVRVWGWEVGMRRGPDLSSFLSFLPFFLTPCPVWGVSRHDDDSTHSAAFVSIGSSSGICIKGKTNMLNRILIHYAPSLSV